MIAEIRLQQFRSYLDRKFQFGEAVNIIVGPNASGKTNLLESVLVIAQGSSYRANDNELIMEGKNWARIDTVKDNETRTIKISLNGNKELTQNNKIYKRITLSNQYPVVLFEPNHLLMLSGSPETRRKYLDGILEITKPGYKRFKNDYLKTLRQRNALLKSGRVSSESIFPWNVRLSHLGGFIAVSRQVLSRELDERIGDTYRAIANKGDTINVKYKTVVDIESYESLLLKKLESSLELDILRGFTLYGPHREDMEININTKPSTDVASRGENRSIIVALKIIESYFLERKLEQKPIILLDDVFSELDNNRRQAITNLIKDQQILITTTDAELVTKIKKASVIKL